MKNSEFHTHNAYTHENRNELSETMEDYLEMIVRLSGGVMPVRIKELAASLNVTPSSASKMAALLREKGLVEFERYGYIYLTKSGKREGVFLIKRHDIIHRFLCYINGTEKELEETEKIEHYLSRRTVENIEKLLRNPEQ